MTIQWKVGKAGRGIEWTDETPGPIGGCEHACKWEMPDGTTAECYAKGIAEGVALAAYKQGFEHHYWRPAALRAMVAGNGSRFKFVDSMSDLFGHWVPDEQIETVLRKMGEAPHHTYQSLTKAHGRLSKFMHLFPEHLWVGVSSAPDWMFGKQLTPAMRIRYMVAALKRLMAVKEATGNIMWMSLEPVSWDMVGAGLFKDKKHPLDWVIIGAASRGREYFQPNPDHILKLLDVFGETNTPVFFKGNLAPTVKKLGIRFREDFPAYYSDGNPIPAVFERQRRAIEHGWPTNTFIEGGMVAPPVPAAGQMVLL